VQIGYASDFRAYSSTIADNVADDDGNGTGEAGGIGLALNSELRLTNTIVATNEVLSSGAVDVGVLGAGTSIVPAFSLVGDNTGSALTEANLDSAGNLIGGPIGGVIDPLLGPLSDNGGPTQTHALSADSPALEAGDPGFSGLSFDQRGAPFNRVQNGRVDLGAVERFDVDFLVVDTLVDELDFDYSAGDLSLREALNLSNEAPLASTIRFDDSLSGETILLTMGQLEITDIVDVSANGLDAITIDASGNDPTPSQDNGDGSRVFLIDDGNFDVAHLVILTNFVIAGGDESGSGGGIYSRENLRLEAMTITDNAATSSGGLQVTVPANGSSVISNVEISHNRAVQNGAASLDGAIGGAAIGGFSGSTITLQNVNVHDNTSVSFDGGIEVFTSAGTANVSDIVIRDNEVTGISEDRGGGTFLSTASGQITVERATISGNQAGGRTGGALLAASGGSISLLDSEVTSNNAFAEGGGLYLSSQLGGAINIQRTTIADNVAVGSGGGIFIRTDADGVSPQIENSTISGNASGNRGGGVAGTAVAGGPAVAVIHHSTIFGNSSSDSGGGVANLDNGATSLVLNHTIVAGNERTTGIGVDVTVGVVPLHSLIGDNEGTPLVEAPVGSPDDNGNLIGGTVNGVIDPKLGPLQNNGGLTQTHELLPTSPALDAGDATLVMGVTAPDTDQRGGDRIRLGRIDLGAFELQDALIDPDFNNDGSIDHIDIDLLQANLVDGPADPSTFDLNGDGAVDISDRNEWLALAGAANLATGNPYLLGDANLDGTVDGADFLVWNVSKFTNSSNWSDGDFDANGTVDGGDFLIWNSNKFLSADDLFAHGVAHKRRSSESLAEDEEPENSDSWLVLDMAYRDFKRF
jgi:hypothetical protein